MTGCFAHVSLFLVRDYIISFSKEDVVLRILINKSALVSYLSWVSLWLGFHTLGIFIHNDTVVSFGSVDKQVLIEPVLAQIIQSSSGKNIYGLSFLKFNYISFYSWIYAVQAYTKIINQSFDSLFIPVGPGDFISHHSIALGFHVTVLVFMKGCLDSCSSKLMPDKIQFGF